MITKLAITLVVAVFLFCFFKVVWFTEPKSKEGHNICLGFRAGHEITDEAYQFRLRTDPNGPELATTMTHEEWKHVYAVINRANWNQIRSDNIGIGSKTLNDPLVPCVGNTGLGGKVLKNIPNGNTRESIGLTKNDIMWHAPPPKDYADRTHLAHLGDPCKTCGLNPLDSGIFIGVHKGKNITSGFRPIK